MPVANSAASAASSSLPKWQLALVVGAPVALGLGYIYYKNVNPTKSSKDNKGEKSNGNITDKQISIDGEIHDKISDSETATAKAQKYKKQGNQAFGAGKYDEAIYYYNSAIEHFPEDETDELSKTYQNRAAAYDALEKYSAVKEDCTKALELNPTYVKALLRRARVMEKTNDLEKALEDVTAACILERFVNQSALLMADRVLKQLGKQHAEEYMLKRVPVMPSKHFIGTYFSSFRNDPTFNEESLGDATNGLARALKAFREQNYDDIIEICTEEIDRYNASDNSDKFKLYLIRGTFYLLLGEHKKAIDDLETIINNEEADKDLRVNALIKSATMYMQLENPDKCFADFDKAVKINPNCGDIYHHRGQVHLFMDKINEARADSEMALKLNPNCGITFAQKSYTDYRYATINRSSNAVSASPALEKARADFERAFKLFPDCCECYTLYGQLLWDSQLYEEADLYFGKAIEMDPMNATVYVHKGLLQLQWTGNIEVGTKYIKKALECDDKCEFAYETLGTIEVQKGNLAEAIALFDKALTLTRTSLELTHIFSLQDAAKAQLKIGRILPKDSLLGLQGMPQ